MARRTVRWSRERGAELVEVALMLPLLVFVGVGIFEFGRAFGTQLILTNAAREGARVAILPDASVSDAQDRVLTYMETGMLSFPGSATVSVDQDITMANGVKGSRVTVGYPFSFILLNGVARLVVSNPSIDSAFTMTTQSEMRNENQ